MSKGKYKNLFIFDLKGENVGIERYLTNICKKRQSGLGLKSMCVGDGVHICMRTG